MKNGILLLIILVFVAGISNFDSITLDNDLVVGDDITVTDDVTIGDDLSVTGDISVTANLDLGAVIVGQDTFTTTAAADTVVISGALATDYYIVSGVGGSVDQQDVLQVEAKADTLIVHRLASGASGLVYNWIRVK